MIGIDIIIFDMDGTLIDSRKVIVNAANYTLSRLGLEKKPDKDILKYVGSGIRDLIVDISDLKQDSLIEKGVELFKYYWSTNLSRESELFPNVEKVLKHFSNKHKLILSNGNMAVIEKALKSFRINNYFENLISGDDEDCLKPSTCPIGKAINITDKIKRKRTLMVGDMAVDIESGKSAGTKTCAVSYGMGTIEEIKEAKPDFIIDDISQLMDIFK
ncbi:MAG: HAD family hydrolase [Actinomycetota bacterium]